jgi:hypothetical protein
MSEVHHDLRRLFADALVRAAGGFEDTATGRMIVANLDDLTMAAAEVVKDLEVRLGLAEDERVITEFRAELESTEGAA